MDNKNYVMIGLSMALLISLGFNAIPESTHYCDSRELKAYCFDLSSTGKTCYTLPERIGGKRCTEGWQVLKSTNPVEISSKQYLCNNQECVPK